MEQFHSQFVCFFFLIVFTGYTRSFNLDTKFAIMYGNEQNDSYFGYSVVLQSFGTNRNKYRMIVGAPRAENRKVSSGNVFQCVLGESCLSIPLPVPQKSKINSNLVAKDGDWMGGAIDIQQLGTQQRYVMCGHRWADTDTKQNAPFMAGSCVSGLSDELGMVTGDELKLIYDTTRTIIAIKPNFNVYNWQLGQAGISSHMIIPDSSRVVFPGERRPELLIGAPGIYNWLGNVIECEKDVTGRYMCYTPTFSEGSSFDLTGYQVSSGHFFNKNDLVYVASAPRSKGKGRILLLNLITPPFNRTPKSWSLIISQEGATTGEYFGASLAVGDFNGDTLDDLIVGAPLRFQIHDEGCVDLFYGKLNAKSLNTLTVKTICGRVPGARFGTSLMAIGDLDRDGYGDLAVGAPYENDNRGAVYIYNGGIDGLGSAYSQKISAEHIDGRLRGFGISIARPIDLDENEYPDIAVGSYISSHVIILRTYPVVQLYTQLSTNVQGIDLKTTSFIITACVYSFGENIPLKIPIQIDVRLFDDYGRVYFKSTNTTKEENKRQIVNGEHCENLDVSLTEHRGNALGAVEISMNVSMAYDDLPVGLIDMTQNGAKSLVESNEIIKTRSVLNKEKSRLFDTLRMEFALDCGVDNICDAEIDIDIEIKDLRLNEYVIGSTNKLDLKVNVSNSGETAYGVKLNIFIPYPVLVAQFPTECGFISGENDNTVDLMCEFYEPLEQGKNESLTISLDMSRVASSGEISELNFLVNTSTNKNTVDKNAGTNFKNLKLQLRYEANIVITGKTSESTIRYAKLNESTKEFKHEYKIEKLGTSPIELIAIEIKLPSKLKLASGDEEAFLEIYKPTSYQDGQPIKCESDSSDSYLKDITEIEENDGMLLLQREKRMAVEETSDDFIKRTIQSLPANRTFFLNCSSATVVCSRVKCTSRPFRDKSVAATVTITMRLNLTLIGKYLGNRDIILLETTGSAHIERPAILAAVARVNTASVATTFFGEVAKQAVSEWLIAVSVGGGILLLLFIIMALIKAGFFQRKKKEELEALISADKEEKEQYRKSMMPPSDSEDE